MGEWENPIRKPIGTWRFPFWCHQTRLAGKWTIEIKPPLTWGMGILQPAMSDSQRVEELFCYQVYFSKHTRITMNWGFLSIIDQY